MRKFTLREMPLVHYSLIAFIVLGCSCSAARQSYRPEQKFAPERLKKDYSLFRKALEESHPSLYWFTPKDSVNYYFDKCYREINDSLTERQFRTLLTYVVSKIRCGHTSVRYSKRYTSYLDTAKLKAFPLSIKCWPDTMIVTGNLNRKDSILVRGTILTSINGHPVREMIDTFFNYLTGDGYAQTGRYQSLSNLGNFGVMYKNVYGLTDSFHIGYLDRYGLSAETDIPVFDPAKDSLINKEDLNLTKKERQKRDWFFIRNLEVDTGLHTAYMTLNTFGRGHKLKRFFRRSFRGIRQLNLQSLVVDVRSNGGGDAGNATLLTQYLAQKPFRVADSLYAIKRSSRYRDYIKGQPLYWLMMKFVTSRRKDGRYHFGYYERHYFKPKKKNHFDGDIYIITGGNSFSATAIFAEMLKGQENVKIVGEESGGGSYGNTAWMIPEMKLPETGIRLRLPKFRLVMREALVKDGRGVLPDVPVAATVTSIRNGIDIKSETVRNLILQKRNISAKK